MMKNMRKLYLNSLTHSLTHSFSFSKRRERKKPLINYLFMFHVAETVDKKTTNCQGKNLNTFHPWTFYFTQAKKESLKLQEARKKTMKYWKLFSALLLQNKDSVVVGVKTTIIYNLLARKSTLVDNNPECMPLAWHHHNQHFSQASLRSVSLFSSFKASE